MSDTDSVYKVPGASSKKTYHSDPDCRHIRAAKRDPVEYPALAARRSRREPCATCITGTALLRSDD